MVVTRGGLVAYGLLGMNAPSTLRAGSASCVEAIAEVDSLGLVKRLVVTLPTQRHSAVRFYRSTHGAVQNSLLATPPCEEFRPPSNRGNVCRDFIAPRVVAHWLRLVDL
jgi:hypothetical protein